MAARYIWWEPPERAIQRPRRVIALVMEMGDYDDVERVSRALGEDGLRDALEHAEAGEFRARSWHFWHYRLGLSQPGQVPPMPRRSFE
jgi:ribulose bisphosphate carboxylase small subunit